LISIILLQKEDKRGILSLSNIKPETIVVYATGRAKMSQNKKQNEDLRVRRTRKMLMQALIDLTIEKGFAAITVQHIADRAMINRATFYRHYLDKYDLLDKYMNEVYEMTASQETSKPTATTGDESMGVGAAPRGMVSMFEHVQQHADFYRVMIGAKGDPAFVERGRQFSEMRLRSLIPSKHTKLNPNSPPLELCLSYLSYAGMGAIAWWLNEGRAYTPQQVASWCDQLYHEAIAYVFGKAS
jgi:AcrR family transcriptional regulator